MSDTIAAVASSMSHGGIGIIRVSGSESISIVDSIFQGKEKLNHIDSHKIIYGHIIHNNEIIDEVMVIVMKAPKTYTKEDVVEIDCHGGLLVMNQILQCVYEAGARPAEPGEFTKRAFLNGRIDLSEAESVMDIISSSNEFALKNAMSQLHGSVKEMIISQRKKILYENAFIESALDDPEHISLDGYSEKLENDINNLLKELENILIKSDDGMKLKEGLQTAIVGKPNAGKSSLLNQLAGKERAIVTDIAGTTRDTLEEQIMLSGIQLNIIDTAGIHETNDIVEKIGVQKAYDTLEKADCILFVVDSSLPLSDDDFLIIDQIKDKKVITLLNKTDLEVKVKKEDILNYLSSQVIPFSTKNQEGMEELEKTIKDMFFHGDITYNDQVYITNTRQKFHIKKAKESLEQVLESIHQGMPEDFLTIDLMDAYQSLGFVIGESVEEDLVNEIFGKFCMGK